MKDALQLYLEHECIRQQWIRNFLSKPCTKEKVNAMAISSVKFRMKINKQKNVK